MIKHHEQILLSNLPLFTKVSVEMPLEDGLPLPSDACYLYIVDGDGQYLYRPDEIAATPGHVILSTCGLTVGKIIAEQPKGFMASIIVHFNRELLQLVFEGEKPSLWKELETPVNQYVVQTAASELVKAYFEGIDKLFENKAALTDTILKLKLKEIILLLLQTENSEPVQQIIKSLFSQRAFTFREMVDAHIYTHASVENLAMLTNCSVSTFKRKFKEIYKTTPGKYILNKKLEKVATLLKASDEAISDIGYDCGFESPEHLSRTFKKQYGVTPSEYRLDHFVN